VEPPTRVDPQNIVPGSLQATIKDIFILWSF